MRYNGDGKEAAMPKRSSSQHVPKDLQTHFEEITQLTDAFCQAHSNEEYQQLCRELTATLCRKRPLPLGRGKATTWVCGIIHALGMVNFSLRCEASTTMPSLDIFCRRRPPLTTTEAIV